MISYELAKELYIAGYRFKEKQYRGEAAYYFKDITSAAPFNAEYCVVPTLTELIEACGYNICGLDAPDWEDQDYMGGWSARGSLDRKGFGSTPEEAVARLWLALNKK